jgi:bifunctional non-homologous end joining protein LigD
VTNLDKVLWPQAGFTKGEAIDYYARVAETILPHLADRPLTRVRFPDGTESQRFFEKRAPSHTPNWVRTAPIEMGTAGVIDFIVCDERATLIWLAQLAALELHPSLSLAADPETPTVIAFDLDPGAPATIVECSQVGLRVRELFANLGLESFAKTSGSKGLQVYVPLNVDDVDYDSGSKRLSQALARHLEAQHPKLIVSQQRKELRKGRVLIDWSQNDEHKTTVCVYSLRGAERPTVSTPLDWHELDDPASLVFCAREVIERVAERGDLFAAVAEQRQRLPDL